MKPDHKSGNACHLLTTTKMQPEVRGTTTIIQPEMLNSTILSFLKLSEACVTVFERRPSDDDDDDDDDNIYTVKHFLSLC